ncbi:MAG: 50S ribosomal protein L6 [Halobacteriovoraceae bacterium]|nr:50S ribosomal protein L6 [Halobacteriovoraceae bacterium]
MSRIGKQIVNIPEKVEVKIDGNLISVKGPKGNLQYEKNNGINVVIEGKELKVTIDESTNKLKSLWGLSRTLINNMVVGVTEGFTRNLEFNGVGYKAAVQGKTLVLNLGYSHPIEYVLPEGIEAKVVKNTISLSGCDKSLVGFAAAKVRSFRPPEPYKGKGIKYDDERIIRKAGKTGGKAG